MGCKPSEHQSKSRTIYMNRMLTLNQKVLRLRGKEEKEKDLKIFKYFGDALEQQNDKLNHHFI